jgi:hypothetical protein
MANLQDLIAKKDYWGFLAGQDALDYICLRRPVTKSAVRKAKRHFVLCLGCGNRFLAKRADNTTCSPKCQRRALRRSKNGPVSDISILKPLKAA